MYLPNDGKRKKPSYSRGLFAHPFEAVAFEKSKPPLSAVHIVLTGTAAKGDRYCEIRCAPRVPSAWTLVNAKQKIFTTKRGGIGMTGNLVST